MSCFNKVILIGNLTRDPEVKHFQGNGCVLNFSIGINKKWYDNNGDAQEQVSFPNCVAWGKKALFIEKYFHKGSKILIEGELRTKTYKDQEGKTQYVTYVLVDNPQFAGGKRGEGRSEDDIPFPSIEFGNNEVADVAVPF